MQTEIDKSLLIVTQTIPATKLGLWFIYISLSIAILLQLYFLPFTANKVFSWGFGGWLIDIVLSLTLLIFLTGLLFKADWARRGLLKFAWMSISTTLIGLLVAIGYYDVSNLDIWHYLIITSVFIWNVWAILFLTKNEVLAFFNDNAKKV